MKLEDKMVDRKINIVPDMENILSQEEILKIARLERIKVALRDWEKKVNSDG